jgi:hypothetical protein
MLRALTVPGLMAGALFLSAAGANAAVFDFQGSLLPLLGTDLGKSSTFLDTTSTVSVEATAVNTEQPPEPNLNQNAGGLGVNLGDCLIFCPDNGGSRDVNQLDNIGDDEAIVFDFGSSFLFQSLTVSLGLNDAYSIYGSNDGSVENCTSGGLICLTGVSAVLAQGSFTGFDTVDLTGSDAYRYLIVTAPGGSGDGFRIKKLTASPDDTPVVPLPATGLLLLAGLGGLGVLRRRK